MAFRDDREVLKQKARDLERDLAEAESKLAAERGEARRAEKLEAELSAAKATLQRIEAQLAKPEVISRNPLRKTLLVLGLIGAGVGATFWLLRASPAPAPTSTVAAPADPLPTDGTGIQINLDLRDRKKTLPPRSPESAVTAAPAPVKEVTTRWVGKAKTVTGLPIKPGAGCSVDAVLRSNNRHEVTIRCGEEVLYRSTAKLEGTAHLSSGVRESPGELAGTARAAISWGDVGARSGPRTQASINSEARIASAWRDTVPPYRVDIEIAELSEPYQGTFDAKHSLEALAFKERVERSAKITKTKGKSPVAAGARCTVSVAPHWDDECRAKLTCGTHVVYGAGTTGFSKCDVADGKPTAFRDESLEGDPMLTWDIAKGTAALIVKDGEADWSADFSVSEK
jgi:hypothetical protein